MTMQNFRSVQDEDPKWYRDRLTQNSITHLLGCLLLSCQWPLHTMTAANFGFAEPCNYGWFDGERWGSKTGLWNHACPWRGHQSRYLLGREVHTRHESSNVAVNTKFLSGSWPRRGLKESHFCLTTTRTSPLQGGAPQLCLLVYNPINYRYIYHKP